MTLPNFLLVGTARSGSTFLYRVLRQHPDVYLPARKELVYFSGVYAARRDNGLPFTLDDYRRYFTAAGQTAIGEMSPNYMYTEWTPRLIAECLPDVKLIFTLRDPVERAYSHYWHNIGRSYDHIQNRKETLTFAEAIQRERERLAGGNHEDKMFYSYVDRGFYMRQIAQFLPLFPRDQMHFILFDELKVNPSGVIADLCKFLDVAPFMPDHAPDTHHAIIPRYIWLHRMLTRLRRSAVGYPAPLNLVSRWIKQVQIALPRTDRHPPMRPSTRDQLREGYAAANAELATFLGCKTPLWKNF